MEFRELWLNGKYQELYEQTKDNLNDHTAKAYYLATLFHYVGTDVVPDTIAFHKIISSHEAEFESKKETYPLEYGLFLFRLASSLTFDYDIHHAIKIANQSIDVLENQDKFMAIFPLINLGHFYWVIGNMSKYTETILKAYDIANSGEYTMIKGFVGTLVGTLHFVMGKYDLASKYMLEGLNLLKHDYRRVYARGLITYTTQLMKIGKREEAYQYLEELEVLSNEFPVMEIKLKYLHALYNKTSNRLRHKIAAENIFRELIGDDPEDFIKKYGFISVIEDLCDLLLDELKLYGEREVYNEIVAFNKILFDYMKKSKTYNFLVTQYIIKSRLYLSDGDFNRAEEILEEAKLFFIDLGLPDLVAIIDEEIIRVENEFKKELNKFKSNMSIAEKIKAVELSEYMKIASRFRD